MSALYRTEPALPPLRPITIDLLEAVLAIEVEAYPFAWTRGNFIDSIAAGYLTRARFDADGALIGYFVAMAGYEEMHLLNITVAPARQGGGHGRALLAELYRLAAASGAAALWLEVRESNERARALYTRQGFTTAGRRRHYYPAAAGQREDAILMNLDLRQGVPHALD